MQWTGSMTIMKNSGNHLFGLTLILSIFQGVLTYDKIFMGHATIKPGYNFVCHQRTVFNTLGGQIDSRKEYYESGLTHCSIVITSPPGTLIDFRFTEVNIIASNFNTCEDASLQIYDGSSNGKNLLHGFPNGICGQAIPSFIIRSTTNSIFLQLMVTSPYTSTFSAIYTAYSPRTSTLCFYCGDLCLQAKEQLCDGLNNCRNGEDEALHQCTKAPDQPRPGPSTTKYDEDVKLVLVFVFASTSFIFFFIIIGLLLRRRLCRTCLEKRRHRRASEAAQVMLHSYTQRTASGNSIPPVSLGPNRPFMAGPTIPTSSRPGSSTGRLAPRSDMPPPYSALPSESETCVQQVANERQETVSASQDAQYSDLNGDVVTLDHFSTSNRQVIVENHCGYSIGPEEESSFIENQTPEVVTVNSSQRSAGRRPQEIHQITDSTDVATGILENPFESREIEAPRCESSTQTSVAKSEESSTEELCGQKYSSDTTLQFETSVSSIASPECQPCQINHERDTDIQSSDTAPSHDTSSMDNNQVSVSYADTAVAQKVTRDHLSIPATSGFQASEKKTTLNTSTRKASNPSNEPPTSGIADVSIPERRDDVISDIDCQSPDDGAIDLSASQPAHEIDNTPVEVSTRDVIQSIDLNMKSGD